jgi:ParB family chromosome partitioning protein
MRTDEKIGMSYGLSKNTVARYLRLKHLDLKLMSLLDIDKISFVPAVTLSFINESEQILIANCIKHNKLSVDMKKAELLRQLSEKNKLNHEMVYKVLSGEMTPKPNRTPTVKIRNDIYAKYFKQKQSAKEVQDIVEKALAMYFE